MRIHFSEFIVIILISSLLFPSCRKTEKSFYKEGGLKNELTYKGDVLDGTQFFYFKNGKLQSEFNYKNGVLHGISRRFHETGNLESTTNYVNGKKEGEQRLFNLQGILVGVLHYENDNLNGPYRNMFPNGRERIIGLYKNNQFDSTWTYYNNTGMVIGQGEFKTGKGVLKYWGYKGNLLREVNYSNSLKNGEERIFDNNGKLLQINIFKDDNLIEEILK